ncbi:MAG: 30S ribosomal protein S2, partial [Anaerolineales bacterium]|nr:30S ribosomal protein S2 [Anaerolineales bacterium]
ERMRDGDNYGRLTKKEILIINRQIERLQMLLSGVRTLVQVPDLLFVVDVHREATAIHEANLLNIPVIAMVDTNCDPRNIDYVVPSNDDAIRAIKLIVGKIADAAVEGRAMRKDDSAEIEAERRAARIAMDEQVELSDEELLGEATLAKIAVPVHIEPELAEDLAEIAEDLEAEAPAEAEEN